MLARGTPEEIVIERLRAREPADVASLVQRTGLPAADTRLALQHLLENDEIVLLDPAGGAKIDGRSFVVSGAGWRRLADRVAELLRAFHAAHPLRRGLPKEELRTRLGAEPRLFVREFERLQAAGLVAEDGPYVRLATHSVRFSPAQKREIDHLLGVLRLAGVSPPDRTELETTLGLSPELVDALLAQGRLIELAVGLLYERDTLDRLVGQIQADIQTNGPRTVAQLRDVLDASRKFTLALVNYTDEHKITRRQGDERVLY